MNTSCLYIKSLLICLHNKYAKYNRLYIHAKIKKRIKQLKLPFYPFLIKILLVVNIDS